MPKWKLKPIDGAAHGEPLDQDARDKILRSHARQRGIEGQHDRPVEPGRSEKPQFGGLVGQPEQRLAGIEEGARMRLEGQHRRRPSQALWRDRCATAITARWPRCTPSKLPMASDRAAERAIGRSIAHDEEAFRRHRASMVKKTCGAVGAAAAGPSQAVDEPATVDGAAAIADAAAINPIFKHPMIDHRALGGERLGAAPPRRGADQATTPRHCPRQGAEPMALDPSMPVLVVDDYSTMVRIIRNLLRQLGFADVDDASDGIAALAKMHAKRYGLVISDWNMEPMTGFDLLRQVRADPDLR